MTRVRTVVIIGLVLLFLGLATSRTEFFVVFYAIVLVLVVTYFWARLALSRVQLVRQTRARRAQVGSILNENFTLRNRGAIRNMWLEVNDESDLPGHHASHVISSLTARGEYAWKVRTYCRERGRFRLGPITLTSGDPFGLFRIKYHLPHTSNVVVYPKTVALRSFPLPIGLLPGGDALRRRTHYITTNAAGVRDYAPGDPFNRIHWKSTARKDRLIVKEFELDPLADVWILLDLWSGTHYGDRSVPEEELDELDVLIKHKLPHFSLPPSTEEYAICAAASIAQFFLRRDRTLGFMAIGQRREVLQADRGERQLEKILETLAVLRAEGHVPFEELLYRETPALPRGSTLILISPSPVPRWAQVARHLKRSGVYVTAVVLDVKSFGGPPGTENVIAELAASGIPISIVRSGDQLEEVLSTARYGAAQVAA
jgi:uncharacterized protein (DUF58 family)